jgi:tellurium resistance protein TerZ
MAISLKKGQRISLEKDSGQALNRICVGLNWGAIIKKGLLWGVNKEAVDLDASCGVYDSSKTLIDVVYFGKLASQCKAIAHSGDDVTGDLDGDDGLDNEIIIMDLSRLPQNAQNIVFILNSFKGHDFETVPHASLRIYEGTPERVDNVVATYDIANDPKFRGHVSMIMGRFYRNNGKWKFAAIGEPTKDKTLKESLETVMNKYI